MNTSILDNFLDDKLNFPLFANLDNKSKLSTLRYMFNHIRTGNFLSIKNGKVAYYIPFYNVNYTNNWHKLLDPADITRLRSLGVDVKDPETWIATNCLLHLDWNQKKDVFKMATFLEVKNMFDELCSVYKIPDIDLFINTKDFPVLKKDLTEPFNHIFNSKEEPLSETYSRSDIPYCPILSFNSNPNFTDIPIPTNQEWETVTEKIYPSRCDTVFSSPPSVLEWNKKEPIAVFRGKSTGCSMSIENNPRLKISELDKKLRDENISILNAGITSFANHIVTEEGSN